MFAPTQREIEIFGQKLTVRSMSRVEATRYRARISAASGSDEKLDEAMAYLVSTCILAGAAPAFKNPAEALAVDSRAFNALVDACIEANRPEDEQGPDPTPAPPTQM